MKKTNHEEPIYHQATTKLIIEEMQQVLDDQVPDVLEHIKKFEISASLANPSETKITMLFNQDLPSHVHRSEESHEKEAQGIQLTTPTKNPSSLLLTIQNEVKATLSFRDTTGRGWTRQDLTEAQQATADQYASSLASGALLEISEQPIHDLLGKGTVSEWHHRLHHHLVECQDICDSLLAFLKKIEEDMQPYFEEFGRAENDVLEQQLTHCREMCQLVGQAEKLQYPIAGAIIDEIIKKTLNK